jgi:hypothetical protein
VYNKERNMSGSKCVPLALVVCAVALGACERQTASAPEYGRIDASALAVCAPSEERVVSATVGVDGGVVAGVGASVEIPEGALAEATTFTVRVPSSRFAEIEVTANGQQQFNFLRPVTIAIDYSRCGSTPSTTATVWHIDPATKAFLEDMHGVNDVAASRVIFSTMHLSGYAIAN